MYLEFLKRSWREKMILSFFHRPFISKDYISVIVSYSIILHTTKKKKH